MVYILLQVDKILNDKIKHLGIEKNLNKDLTTIFLIQKGLEYLEKIGAKEKTEEKTINFD